MTADDHAPSRACHQAGCSSKECELENYRYTKQISLEHARGEYRRIDAAPARAHVEELLAKKWWMAEIGRASGLSKAAISLIAAGQPTISKHNAQAILSIPVVEIRHTQRGRRIDSTGSMRRLRALVVLGHTWLIVGAHTGMTRDRLSLIARGAADGVRPTEAHKIADTYRHLSITPGASKQAATNARKKRWHGPLAWDDIDDPKCKPETGCRSEAKASAKRKVYADPDRVAELTAQNKSAAEIALQLGCHKRTVVRIRGRFAEQVAA